MKQNQKTPQNVSHAIYIAFHIVEDVNASKETARIVQTVKDLFGDLSEKAHEVATMESRELIVKIRRPFLGSSEEEKKFFEKLKRLFDLTKNHKPHYTHVSH